MTRLAWLALVVVSVRAGEIQIEANVRYFRDPQTVLDILQPRAPALKERVGVIVIPGRDSSKEAAGEKFGKVFVDRGWVVAAVEYREDEAEGDVAKAAQWFSGHAAEYRIDPKRIVACCGHLARSVGMAAAIVDLDGGESSKGAPPVLVSPDLSDHVFVWLRKHKIQ